MLIEELIALAKVRSGKQQQQMAHEMGHSSKSRISKIAKGQVEPTSSEIIYLAQTAHMPEINVLAEIEAERHPELAHVWKSITDKVRNL